MNHNLVLKEVVTRKAVAVAATAAVEVVVVATAAAEAVVAEVMVVVVVGTRKAVVVTAVATGTAVEAADTIKITKNSCYKFFKILFKIMKRIFLFYWTL